MNFNENNKWIYLSYFIDEKIPTYRNENRPSIKPASSIESGDSCNSIIFKFHSHTGTHIDFPKHFSEVGKTLNDYPASFWVFKNISILQVRDSCVSEIDLIQQSVSQDTEILLLLTGQGKFRDSDDYWCKGTVFHADTAEYIRRYYPNMRILGVDTLSISSLQNRECGRKTHQAFLCGEPPILLLEDMNLSIFYEHPKIIVRKLIVLPLPVYNADGTPCCVIAEIEGELEVDNEKVSEESNFRNPFNNR